MAILCDGKTWSFYLPAEQGSYDERRVYKLDLQERPVEEAVEKLTRYLGYQRTTTAEAIEDARRDYRDRNRRALARKTVPEAWNDLVDGEEPTLIDRLSIEVETRCGVKPNIDDVVAFLKGLRISPPETASSVQVTNPPPHTSRSVISTSLAARSGYELNGRSVNCRTAKEVMVGILKDLSKADPTFPERCFKHEENQGRVRTYIARTTAELYPGRPDLEQESIEFTPGWFIATNVSNQLKVKIIRMASEVAGITPNVQLLYSL